MTPRLDPRISRMLGNFVSFCSVLSVAFGLWVLTGWMFHIQIMKSILPGQVAVKANTAACFVLIGLALWFLKKEQPPFALGWKLAAQIAAIMASVMGLLSLLECIWGWDLGINRLLFTAGPEDIPGSLRPGLMSPITAIGFLSLGPALLLLDAKRRFGRWLAQSLPCAAAIASMFGILDFVLDPNTTHTYISPATASALFLFAFALLFARQQSGLGALVASAGVGGTLTRRLVSAAILAPLAIGWLRWKAELAGLFSEWTGLTIMTVLSIVLLAGLTAWTASVIDRTQWERDQTERARSASEERFRSLLDGVRDHAIYMLDPDGRVVSWHAGAENVKGYRADEILGEHFSCFYTAKDRENGKPNQELQKAVSLGRFEDQGERVRKNGSAFWANFVIAPLRDESGKLRGFCKVVRDVTERKRAEEKLRAASLYTRNLLEASLDPLVTISREGKITDVNRATEAATGVSRERLIGSDFSDYFTQPEKARQGYERVFARGSVRDYPLAIRHSSGGIADVLYNATLFKNEDGEIEGVFAAARDVTERKQAEDALRESELRIRTLLDSTAEAILGDDLELNCTFSNPASVRLLGYQDPDELLGKNLHAAMHHMRPDGTPLSAEDCQLAQSVREGRAFHADDLVFGRKDGTSFPAECWSHPLVKNGRVTGSVVTFFDITERKRAEEEIRTLNQELEQRVQQRTEQLHESERRVRRKLESILSPEGDLGSLELADILDIPAVQSLMDDFCKLAHLPMFILDLKGNPLVSVGWQEICTKFHRAHPEACKNCLESDQELSTGVAPGEFKLYKCKNNLWDVVTPILVGGQHVGNLFSGQFFFTDEPVDYALFRTQARKYGFDEAEYLAAMERVPRLSREGVDTGMAFLIKFAQVLSQLSYSGIKLARSVTEIGRVNAELAASVKELEAFTYSVSHDLRAPLRHISGFSKILTEEYGSTLPTDAQHHLQRIQEGTLRMGLLVDDLLNLARVGRRDLSLRVAGLKSLADEVIAELAPECAGREIEWKIGSLPFAECDPGLIKQVLQNLLSNAVKFTRPRAHAVIEVGQEEEHGNSAVFVRDNGVGFSMKYADKLFGVFQRLHRPEDFEGTGVGLAIVQRIVQKHGGRIWVEAELEKGATFYFTLGASEKTELKTKAAMAGDKA